MKKNALLTLLVLLFFNCSKDSNPVENNPTEQNGPTEQNDPNEPETPPLTVIERLQQVIDEKVGDDTNKLVGVSVSIRINGEEKYQLTGGLSKLNVPTEPDMRFGIGSITKTAVAATVLKLEEEGLLSLEDTIGELLTLNNPNVDDSITILQLLAHFTGVEGYFKHPDIWPRVEGNLDTAIAPEELVAYIGPPINEPGITHEYSNSNYLLLGLIIEAVTGQTVGEVMRERFWTRLQLDNIYFGSNETVLGTMATPWRDGDGDGALEDIEAEFKAAYFSVFYCAAGIYSTASDLSMWAYHLYEGDALSGGSKTKMMTPYFLYEDSVFLGYGLGARQNRYAGHTMWGHTGGMRGYGSHMFYDPITKVSIAVLNNQSRSEDGPLLRHELTNELLAIVFDSL
ncbi:MAG: serine hydrolase domain-containing protein [Aurantibacter sp.]